jgi:hypothetical protein
VVVEEAQRPIAFMDRVYEITFYFVSFGRGVSIFRGLLRRSRENPKTSNLPDLLRFGRFNFFANLICAKIVGSALALR